MAAVPAKKWTYVATTMKKKKEKNSRPEKFKSFPANFFTLSFCAVSLSSLQILHRSSFLSVVFYYGLISSMIGAVSLDNLSAGCSVHFSTLFAHLLSIF